MSGGRLFGVGHRFEQLAGRDIERVGEINKTLKEQVPFAIFKPAWRSPRRNSLTRMVTSPTVPLPPRAKDGLEANHSSEHG